MMHVQFAFLPFVSPHRRLVSTPSCSDPRRTPHLNTNPTSKNDQPAGSPAGNSGVVRENSRGLIGSAVFSLVVMEGGRFRWVHTS